MTSPESNYRIVRREALRTACQDRMPMDAMVLPPVPGGADATPRLVFPVSLWDHGEPPRITRPWIAVAVSAESEEGSIDSEWLDEPGQTDWIAYYRADVALAISRTERTALEDEYASLALEYVRGNSDVRTTERMAELFRFLVPAELLPWYRRINAEFLDRLEARLGESLAAPARLPETHAAASRWGWLQDLVPPGDRDRLLSPGTLRSALNRLHLTAAEHSPLVSLDPGPSGFDIEDVAPDWPSEDWQRALTSVCRPAWLVELIAGDTDGWARVSTYVGGADGDQSWVVHDFDGVTHLLSFQRQPEEPAALIERLLSAVSPAVQGDRFDLLLSEAAALFALADRAVDSDGGVPLAELEVAPAALAVWSDVTALLTPFEVSDVDLRAGIRGLERAGWIALSQSNAVVTAEGSAVIESLGGMSSAIALRAIEFAPEGECTHASGFVAVTTADRLWLGGVADEWDCESPPRDPRITLVACRPDEVVEVAARLLDLSAL